MTEDGSTEAQSYTAALREIIARYIPTSDYEVKLENNQVEVTAGPHRFSFRALLLNNQDLGELELALREASRSGEDPLEELAVQLGYMADDDGGPRR